MSDSATETKEITLPETGMVDAKVITKVLGISPSMWSKLKQAGAVKPAVRFGNLAKWDVDYIRELMKTGVSLSKAS